MTTEKIRRELKDAQNIIALWKGLYEWAKVRAEEVEQERDEARSRLAEAAKEIREQGETIAELAAEQPRTLTADDITDEMAERAREEFFGGNVGGPVSGPSSARRWRAALTAALAEPPARPEGAEDIEAVSAVERVHVFPDAGCC